MGADERIVGARASDRCRQVSQEAEIRDHADDAEEDPVDGCGGEKSGDGALKTTTEGGEKRTRQRRSAAICGRYNLLSSGGREGDKAGQIRRRAAHSWRVGAKQKRRNHSENTTTTPTTLLRARA